MPTASPNGTYKTGSGASIVDGRGVIYAINSNGQITINGKVDPITARVDALGFFNGLVWQKNADNSWYSKSPAAATWANYPSGIGNPMPVPQAAINGQVAYGSDGPPYNQLYDTHGNLWQINAAKQIVIDGRVDTTTNRVIAMALVNGRVWQENVDGNWYSKMKPSDTWTSAVRPNPVLAAEAARETWIGGRSGNNPLLGINWSKGVAPTPDRSLYMTGGVMNLGSGDLGGNTLTISGEVPISYDPLYGGFEAVAPTINMTAGAVLHLATAQSQENAVTVNVTGGRVSLDVRGPYPSTPDVLVTADKLSSVLLSGGMVFGRLVEHGGAVLLNNSFAVSGTNVLLDSSLAGAGTVLVGSAQSHAGMMEITGAVGADVILAVHGDPYRNAFSTLTLDSGLADHGSVTLQNSYLVLKSLGKIDSLSYKNSMLSLYNGNAVVEAVRVAGIADPPGGISNGVLSFAYSAGTLTVHDGGAGTITGLARHA